MENGLSAADVALLNNDGMGGWNGMIWLFAILALMGGGFGGFGNANNQYATSAEVQRGFDAQNSMANEREILSAISSGTAQTVAATNQTFHDSLMANQNLYNEMARDISNVQLGLANILANQNECCCSTKMLIQETSAQNRYDSLVNTQKILDTLSQNKIEALQAQINQLQLAQATNGMLKFPNSWTYGAGEFPPLVVAVA